MILLGVGMAYAQQGKPFPHRTHLELGMDCATCHASVAASTTVSDNLLPNSTVCKQCHDTVSIPPPRPTSLTKFSHARHVKLGNIAPAISAAIDKKTYLGNPDDIRAHLKPTANACLACHRGIDTSMKVSDANMPQMADCLVCHNQIEPPFSCAQCHDPKWSGLVPASHHAEDWENRHSTKAVSKQGCSLCHGQKFTCMGCHLG